LKENFRGLPDDAAMGYTTVFWGRVAMAPALDRGERRQLAQFAATRHDGPDTPGIWCQWVPTRDGAALQWDGREKFYFAADWMQHVIDRFLGPGGHRCSGTVFALARAESVMYDAWRMDVHDNQVTVHDYAVPIAELTDDQLDDHETELDAVQAFEAAMADGPGGVAAAAECLRFLRGIGQVETASGLRAFGTDLAALHPNPRAFRAALG
jgi:hypothetical protein